MGNPITQDKIKKARERFVHSINPDDVCHLASSFRDDAPCRVFQPVRHGAFNICFFVEFYPPPADKGPERWVVRIPMLSSLPLVEEKMEIELATVSYLPLGRYVSEKTTIPIPKVHAYSLTANNSIGLPFTIMDYVEGQNLKDLGFRRGRNWVKLSGRIPTAATKHLHRQLADVYIQLRQLEFPRIGALGLPSKGVSLTTCHADDIQVCNRPLSLEMVLQESEGLDPSTMIKPKQTYSTSREFVDALMWLADNKLDKSPDLILDERGAMSVLYAAHHFKKFINDTWLHGAANNGPFVLMHGDMNLLYSNLLFDKDYNLVAIIDWEWSLIVPAQFLVPPAWLTGGSLDFIILGSTSWFNREVQHLRAAVKDREAALELQPRLSDEWAPMETGNSSPIASALLCPEKAYNVYWDLIFKAEFPITLKTTEADIIERYCKVIFPRISQFVETSEDRKAFLARKIQEQTEFFEAEKEYFNLLHVRKVLNESPQRYSSHSKGSPLFDN
ncbi:Uncharacterized protein TPAR_04053 [Tolypocladium paradoxum]|uniref:Aminoglycoside phosphotransferase domain-containing protein n=1 Tax=Tolypocladium paradoxum TaxID=94208 RepID=A0A2S4KZV8_9HYPO|nr:Uncharacterized protein TPAR_04053 [Tolypocladium paradoxum]